jgi:hypothetical protein
MDLNIAEIPFDSGELHYRYSRYLAEDGKNGFDMVFLPPTIKMVNWLPKGTISTG